MKKVFVAHLAYIAAVVGIIAYHNILPRLRMHWEIQTSQKLLQEYEAKMLQLSKKGINKPLEKTMLCLKEVVIYSKLLQMEDVRQCLAHPELSAKRTEELFFEIKNRLKKPQKHYLRYSKDCLFGVFCSLSFPLLIVTLVNAKSLASIK
ncbi:hypothetical protein NEDG_01344 [Nematocida displodere]|uniref:Uncharacterized protein n=1 Tax=Nematocida displodere TaxID=1805483 RepID=A0A177ECM2_9MICR|nr:hypothetical protein NEDG_01344 [Nematocida displodere]